MQISQWQWDAMSNILEWLKSDGLTKLRPGTSLVGQWLTLCLPKQETTVWLLGPGGLHMPGSNYYWASTTEPAHESLCSATREATTMSWHPTESSAPLTTTRESPWAATKTQCSQKLMIKKKPWLREAVESLGLSYRAGRDVKWYQPLWEMTCQFIKNLNAITSNSTSRYLPLEKWRHMSIYKKGLCVWNVHSCTYDSPKLETTQIAHQQANKQTVFFSYNGMLISNKKEQILINSNTYDLKIILLKEAR